MSGPIMTCPEDIVWQPFTNETFDHMYNILNNYVPSSDSSDSSDLSDTEKMECEITRYTTVANNQTKDDNIEEIIIDDDYPRKGATSKKTDSKKRRFVDLLSEESENDDYPNVDSTRIRTSKGRDDNKSRKENEKPSGSRSRKNEPKKANNGAGKKQKLSCDINDDDEVDDETVALIEQKLLKCHNVYHENIGRFPDDPRGLKPNFDRNEQRIMIFYLMKNHAIDGIKSPGGYEIWKLMLKEGYLKHRKYKSLQNHFRKTILPQIEAFKKIIPDVFYRKFLAYRAKM